MSTEGIVKALWGGGQLPQILGRYVLQQNQKYTHNPGKIFHGEKPPKTYKMTLFY